MTARPTRTSRIRRTVVAATLTAAMLVPTAASAAPKNDGPNQGKKATAESPVTTQGLSWLGLSWL